MRWNELPAPHLPRGFKLADIPTPLPDAAHALGRHLRMHQPDGWFIPSALCHAGVIPLGTTYHEETMDVRCAAVIWAPAHSASIIGASPLLDPWADVAVVQPSTDGEWEEKMWGACESAVAEADAPHSFMREWAKGSIVVIQHKVAGYPRAGTIVKACLPPEMLLSRAAQDKMKAEKKESKERQNMGDAAMEVSAHARAVMEGTAGEDAKRQKQLDAGAAVFDDSEVAQEEIKWNHKDKIVSRANFVESRFRGTPIRIYSVMLWLQHQYPSLFRAPISCHSDDHLMRYSLLKRAVLWHPDLKRNIVPGPDSDANAMPRFSAWVLVANRPDDVHANLMLYDRLERTVVRYEPRGWNGGYDAEDMDAALAASLRKHLGCRYIPPREFQAKSGPQRLEYYQTDRDTQRIAQLGPCAYWCLLFLHTKLRSPHLLYRDIARLLRNIPASLTASIEAYGHLLARVELYLPPCPILRPSPGSYHT